MVGKIEHIIDGKDSNLDVNQDDNDDTGDESHSSSGRINERIHKSKKRKTSYYFRQQRELFKINVTDELMKLNDKYL
eukprot:Pgem_evm1s2131